MNYLICRRCFSFEYPLAGYIMPIEQRLQAFDRAWNEMKICECPYDATQEWMISILEPPPNECPYILEHIIENGKRTKAQ